MKFRRRSFCTPVGCVRRARRESSKTGAKMKPRAYPSTLSLPGLTRQSILLRKDFLRRRWMRGSSPRMTSEDAVSRITPFSITPSCTIASLLHRPRIEGWAERRETFGCCAKHPLGDDTPSPSRGAFLRPGFATLLHSPRTEGWAEHALNERGCESCSTNAIRSQEC